MEVGGHRSETRSRALSVEIRGFSSGGRLPGLTLETSSSGLVLETRTHGVACLGGRNDLLLPEQHAIMELGLFHDVSMILPGNLSGP